MAEPPPLETVRTHRSAVQQPGAGLGTATRSDRDSLVRRLLALADVAAVAAALALSVFGPAEGGEAKQFLFGLLTLPIWVLMLKLYGLYDRDAKRVSHSTVDDVPWVFHALVMGSLALWFFLRLATEHKLVLIQGLVFFFSAFLFILVGRAAVRKLAQLAGPPARMLIIGGGPLGRLLVRKVGAHPEYGLRPVGYLDDVEERADGLNGVLPYLGEVSDLERVCSEYAVERVAVVGLTVDEASLTDLIRRTKGLDVRVSVVPSAVDVLGPSVEIDDIEGLTVLGVNPPALARSSRALKRAMDVTLAAGLLVIMAPVMVGAALAVKLGSSGPLFYSQERVGRHGRRFRLHKFRTMAVDADERAEGLRALSTHPAWLLLDHDPRVTRVGRWLRRASIDELPQLWNVLRADMSLVGPRPMPPDVQGQIEGWGARRLDLTPGVTGPWQVLGRTNIPFEEMVKLDYLYVTNWSLWWDARLLIRTLPAVLRARGAN